MKQNEVSISVRQIIEFVLRYGDIKAAFLSNNRALEGTKVHQKIQKRFAKEFDYYETEVVIKNTKIIDDITMNISGRIDGIINDEEIPIIDEIKSVTTDLENVKEDYSLLHWAQGKMYAYMYVLDNKLEEIVVQLTYGRYGSQEIKQFQKTFKIKDLETFYMDILNEYVRFVKKMLAYNNIKDKSIEAITFPFGNYRKGQKKLMASVYKVIMEDEKLFARAPTGIGKTMATLFPAIKSLTKHEGKLFYLTAKTIGRDVAEKALALLEENGLILKRITITAKDKLCLNDEKRCDGEHCPYAKGHYDRINEALLELIDLTHNYNRDLIIEYAEKYKVCPYELTLDLTYFCDCIICDYNYAFDPRVALKRYFVEENKSALLGGDSKHIFLIDEAHNLVDRARVMYSAAISKKAILDLKNKLKDKDKTLHRYLGKMNKHLIDMRYACEEKGFVVEKEYSDEFIDLMKGVLHRTEKIFPNLGEWEHMDDLLEFYYEIYDFVKKVELYDHRYVTYYEKVKDEVIMKLFCIDPSFNLKTYMENAKAVVLFSATLTPMDYFVKILGGNKENYGLSLTSPFDSDKLCLLINNRISTRYKDRKSTYEMVAKTIYNTINGKRGNYIVFFPSYAYMEDVYELFSNNIHKGYIKVMKQERGLSEIEKEDFLKAFNKSNADSLVAFAVLGGMFGEGIDLQGEKLSGAIIVGVGLPGICLERDLIKNHFDKQSNSGFQYAYMYPGMNKVMQAAGRVIRTEEDIGVVVLIDQRFGYRDYQSLFPPEWEHGKYLSKNTMVEDVLDGFW